MTSFKLQKMAGKTEERAAQYEELLLKLGELKSKFGELSIEIRGGSPKTSSAAGSPGAMCGPWAMA